MDGVVAPPHGQAPGRALAAGLLELRLTCTAPGPGPRSLVKRVPSAPPIATRLATWCVECGLLRNCAWPASARKRSRPRY